MTTYFYTQPGETFSVNEHGQISRTGRCSVVPSDSWTVRGAVRFNNFGTVAEFVPFPQCFTEPRAWLHKNGKGKWFIADLDHGTRRVQMQRVLCATGSIPT